MTEQAQNKCTLLSSRNVKSQPPCKEKMSRCFLVLSDTQIKMAVIILLNGILKIQPEQSETI